MNKLIRQAYAERPLLGVLSIVLVLCMLGGAIFGFLKEYTAPKEKTEEVTRLTYDLRGSFGYDVQLTDNALYGPITLTEDDASILYLSIVDTINGSFSYRVTSTQPLKQAQHEVEVTGTLENKDNWQKSLVFVPQTVKSGDFTLTFPIDVNELMVLAQVINDELKVRGSSYILTLQANVHTTAQSDYGAIAEDLTSSTSATLQANTMSWAPKSALSQSQRGTVRETVTTPTSNTGWIGTAVALGVVILLGFYVLWNYNRSKLIEIPYADVEAQRARRKYKDIFVDVDDLPLIGEEETVISVHSLDDLAATADRLLRPVLHKAEAKKHVYCIIDGHTRYKYVSVEQPAPAQEEAKPTASQKKDKSAPKST